jgi:hypothetical protein
LPRFFVPTAIAGLVTAVSAVLVIAPGRDSASATPAGRNGLIAVRDVAQAQLVRPDRSRLTRVRVVRGGRVVHPARAKAPTLGRCEVLRSRTVRGTKQVRVFTTSHGYFACLARSNRPFPLVRKSEVAYGLDIVGIQIAGPYVGFGYVLDGADFASVAHVRVLDLRDGTWKHDLLAIDHASDSEVSDIALSHAGGLAWISRGYADIAGRQVPAGCRRTSPIRCDFG